MAGGRRFKKDEMSSRGFGDMALAGKVKDALSGVADQPYFAPLCDARLLAVRHYDWEPISRCGDLLHVVGLALCLCVCLRDVTSPLPPEGISTKSHILFFVVFTTRFINVVMCEQSVALIVVKVVLWTITMKIVIILRLRGASFDLKDTFPVSLLVAPISILTLVLGTYSANDSGLAFEVLWMFSNWLEGFAMLPQYIYCYRDRENRSAVVSAYVICMGSYRLLYGLNWIFPLARGEADLDVSSVFSGALGVVLFADYCCFKILDRSPLASICIAVDDDLRDAQELAIDIARGSPCVLEARPINSDAVSSDIIGRAVAEVELHYVDQA